jgi:hypothetical protein
MPAAEEGEVRERGRAPLRPVAEMMPLGEAKGAPREAAAPVPMVERSPQGRRNRPGPRPDLQEAARIVVAHHHPAGVARQAPGRLRGNARPIPEDRLARLVRIGQDLGVDVDDHLVALARGAGIESVMQGRFREQGQGIGPLLRHRGRFRGNVPGACGGPGPRPALSGTPPPSRARGAPGGLPCRPRPDTREGLGSHVAGRPPEPRPTGPRTGSRVRSARRGQPCPRPTPSSRASVSSVATRVSARTFAYDSSAA